MNSVNSVNRRRSRVPFAQMETKKKRNVLYFFSDYRTPLVLLGCPIFFSPLLFMSSEYKTQLQCAYVVLMMGTYWVFETLPLAITSLLPLIFFPIFGINRSENVAKNYLPDTSFLFIGGLMVALAVEKCDLHQRIALYVLTTVGSDPKWIMAGFMFVTFTLSMFISNTATTALMVPIVNSVIVELATNTRLLELIAQSDHMMQSGRRRSIDMRRLSNPEEHSLLPATKDASSLMNGANLRLAKGLMLSICFAANIGGSATLTGTASNLVLMGQVDKLFYGSNIGLNFLSWFGFAGPSSLVSIVFAWLVLWFMFLRGLPPGSPIVSEKLKERYQRLPPMNFGQYAVSFLFCLLLSLWILRDPQVIPGFGSWFKRGYVTDATSSIFVTVLLFMIPNKTPACFRSAKDDGHHTIRGSLLSWETVQERFPWSVILLLGGGFALADGVKKSELSMLIGEEMQRLSVFPTDVIVAICVIITVVLTNICSNTVVASIFLPIAAELAKSLGVNPLRFMLPITLASSFAFLLPVATPPNAIVFGSGFVKVGDMVKAGFLITLGCVAISIGNLYVLGHPIFSINDFPDWARDDFVNSTLLQDIVNMH